MDTRQQILRAAVDLLINDESVPLDKIADGAGVSKMTLHRHFGGRGELVAAAEQAGLATGKAIVDQAIAETDELVRRLELVMKRAIPRGRAFAHSMRQSSQLASVIDQLKQEGVIKHSLPTQWVVQLFLAQVRAGWHCLDEGSIAPVDVPTLAWQSFCLATFVDE